MISTNPQELLDFEFSGTKNYSKSKFLLRDRDLKPNSITANDIRDIFSTKEIDFFQPHAETKGSVLRAFYEG